MRFSAVGVVTGLVLGLVGAGGALTTRPAAAEDRTDVVAAFYPLAEAVQQVGGRAVRVTNVTPAGSEPHDLELTTDVFDRILDADLAVVLGRDFQPAVEDAADDRDGPTFVVLDHVRADGDDPHVWLDPRRMRRIVGAIRRELSKADPARAGVFARNADRFDAELRRLDADYRDGLTGCARDLVVTAHDAFGYLGSRYGLRVRGVAGIAPGAEPDPDRLAELADLAEREGVTTIFTEELVSTKVAETLAREAGGLRTEVLNPLEGLTDEQRARGNDYLSVMRDNLEKLRAALGCP